jgi:hypothetical protein
MVASRRGAPVGGEWAAARDDSNDLLDRIDRLQPNTNVITAVGRDHETGRVGLNGQLAMAPVNQDGQADTRRSSQVADRIQGSADRPAREQNIIHQHHFRSIDVERDFRPSEYRPVIRLSQVVAVECDIDGSDVHLLADKMSEFSSQSLGQRNSSRTDSDEVEGDTMLPGLTQFSRDARDQTVHIPGIAQLLFTWIHADDP